MAKGTIEFGGSMFQGEEGEILKAQYLEACASFLEENTKFPWKLFVHMRESYALGVHMIWFRTNNFIDYKNVKDRLEMIFKENIYWGHYPQEN